MKLSCSAFYLCAFVLPLAAQTPPSFDRPIEIETPKVNEIEPADSSAEVLMFVEQMPIFKEGDYAGLMKFISKNIVYPLEAVENDIQGKVYLGFVVRTDGTLSDVKVMRSASGASMLDKEAVRVMMLTSGKWTPGKQKGQPVNVRMNFPINFNLR
jgi:protein TonB